MRDNMATGNLTFMVAVAAEPSGERVDPTIPTEAPLPWVTDYDHYKTEYETWARKAALRAYHELGHWDNVADILRPFYQATRSAWWAVSQGRKITLQKANALRRYYKLPLFLPPTYPVPPCPDCYGEPHLGRCHGLPVASVVVLAPGDVVTHNSNGAEHDGHKPRKPKAIPDKQVRFSPEAYAHMASLKEGGQTWNEWALSLEGKDYKHDEG